MYFVSGLHGYKGRALSIRSVTYSHRPNTFHPNLTMLSVVQNLKERDHLGVDRRIILKLIFNKYDDGHG
jgi:hypothetical protein